MSDFGCSGCWAPEAEAAWVLLTKTLIINRLIDEAHYIVSVRRCESCDQEYLQITTETIDWQDGEDPIYRTVLPISGGERENLTSGRSLSKTFLESIGKDRRSLKYDWPKGMPKRIYWGVGILVGDHD